jgi:hypothetical protein
MKLGTVDVKVSILGLVAFAVFAIILVVSSIYSPEVRSNLIWMLPALFLLLIIPIALNYMSRSEYEAIAPTYEAEAKQTRIKLINESMIGRIVKVEGVVERVSFRFLNRPQFLVADRTGEISVKMFTSPQEDINLNDVVEVYGQVIKRYIVTGDPVINCVIIRKIEKKIEAKKKEK